MRDDLKKLCGNLSVAANKSDLTSYEAARLALEPHRAELEKLAKTKGGDQATAKAALEFMKPKKDEGVGFDLGGGSAQLKPDVKKDEKKAVEGGEEPPKDDDGKLEVNVLNTVETNPPDGELPPELQPEVEEPDPQPRRAGGGGDGPRQPRRREANEGGSGFNWLWLVLILGLLGLGLLIGKYGFGGSKETDPPAPTTATTTPVAPPAMTKEDLIDAYNAASEKNRQKDLEALATELDKTTDAIKATDKTQVKSVSEYKTCAEEPNQPSCLAGEAEERKFYGDLSSKKADK